MSFEGSLNIEAMSDWTPQGAKTTAMNPLQPTEVSTAPSNQPNISSVGVLPPNGQNAEVPQGIQKSLADIELNPDRAAPIPLSEELSETPPHPQAAGAPPAETVVSTQTTPEADANIQPQPESTASTETNPRLESVDLAPGIVANYKKDFLTKALKANLAESDQSALDALVNGREEQINAQLDKLGIKDQVEQLATHQALLEVALSSRDSKDKLLKADISPELRTALEKEESFIDAQVSTIQAKLKNSAKEVLQKMNPDLQGEAAEQMIQEIIANQKQEGIEGEINPSDVAEAAVDKLMQDDPKKLLIKGVALILFSIIATAMISGSPMAAMNQMAAAGTTAFNN